MILHMRTERGRAYDIDRNCDRIVEHSAQGEGDKWFYDVYRDGEIIRIFDPVEVVMTNEEE